MAKAQNNGRKMITKLSKTVLEMKFMKRTKIAQDKHDDETENLEILTNQTVKDGVLNNFIIEKNWEIIEKLRSSRLNYGMSKKQQEQSKSHQNNNGGDSKLGNEELQEDEEDYQPKAKHIRYNDEEDEDNY